MRFTNKVDLPTGLFNLLSYDTYNRSGAKFDLSATTLIDAPQPKRLFKEHHAEVEEDVLDRLWSSMGTAFHALLEEANANDPEMVCEKRFIHEIAGKRISAQIDTYDSRTKRLADMKVTSAWKVVSKDFSKWEAQLNIQAALARMSGWEVEGVEVWVICRDFSRARSKEDNYPNIPIQVIDLPLWSQEDALTYIEERIALHSAVDAPPCTDEDRWATPESFAIKQKGKKRALRVLPTKEKALRWAASQNLTASQFSIEHRPAVYSRCENFCNVARWCEQHNATTMTKGDSSNG
ncbi:MAG: hypothetical protein EB156_05190 [Euryarchaeota archaeon]|nr:hypothetical protein [Euryarchaeota archaeon]NDB94145.1 hypothetical protein [Euryarchaeota archaeon]NDF37164.1 hypothetical protein [Euryarchaeota archaeon]NDG22001.1 hypothetical protein [Euryarchaeota archaeon]